MPIVFIREIQKDTIVCYESIKELCKRRGEGYPNGCPNYGKNPLCPPHNILFTNFKDKYNYFYLLYSRVWLEKQAEKMWKLHPDWSEKQAKCSRYWQSTVKKDMRNALIQIIPKYSKFYILGCGSGFVTKRIKRYQDKIHSMESVGINVFRTLKNNNIPHQVKPKTYVTMVSLLCTEKEIDLFC